MKIRPHEFVVENYEDSMRMYDEHIEKWLALLASGGGDPQAICRTVLQFSVWNACILLILGRDEEQAIRYFRQALACGLIGLEAPGSTKGLRSFEVLMEIGEQGSRIVHMHEKRQLKRAGTLSVADVSWVLALAACFGDKGEMEAVARFPEDRYRNPNVMAGEDYYSYVRAWKHLLAGDDRAARKEMQACLEQTTDPKVTPERIGFLRLLDADRMAFLKAVEDGLKVHKKHFQKEPADPEGYIYFPGLMLCRAALDREAPVEDGPYLPVRLLPNYKPVAH